MPHGHGKTVVIIDDDEYVSGVLGGLLEVFGYPVKTYPSAQAYMAGTIASVLSAIGMLGPQRLGSGNGRLCPARGIKIGTPASSAPTCSVYG
jgi:hypothetical protein